MANTLITGAIIVPVDEARPAFFHGDLLVEGGFIKKISEYPEKITPEEGARVIDGSRLFLMPGLINTHGHAAMSLFRGFADDLPLQEWLEKKIWPIEERLSGDDVYWGSMLSIVEMIKGGTTTFADMYFFMDRVAEAAAECGIRAVLCRGLIGVGENSAAALAEGEQLYRDWHGRGAGRITVTLGPHAPYTCPPKFLKEVMASAQKLGAALQIHLSETAGEVEANRREHGCSPVVLLSKLGLFEHKVTAAHCVHLDDEDIAILAQKQVRVAHNPGSNLKLGSGVAPLHKLLEASVTVGLGTDGAASNNNLDMFEEMRLSALLAKGISYNPALLPAGKALELATAGGAEALFLEKLGRLKEGYRADIAGISRDLPHATPLHDAVAHLVYSAAAADVRLVMVDGELILENGELLYLDEEKIKAEAARCAARLSGRTEKDS
ncbi:MAG TPA: amidohydrolase [Bacillota bacterium]|nr:amidohydrolase [Bacillota bacterium]